VEINFIGRGRIKITLNFVTPLFALHIRICDPDVDISPLPAPMKCVSQI
jgi:hypothetical protein